MDDLRVLRYSEDGLIASLTLAQPERGNLIDVAFLEDLARVCDHLEDHSKARVVVIRGDGPDFCRGIDFGEFKPGEPIDIHGFGKWEKALVRLERLPKTTIAALHGRVDGGGFQLALVCDQRIARVDTRMSLPEVRLGILPGMATFRLAKYLGLGRARDLILTGREVDAAEALQLGLVGAVVEDLEARVTEAAATLAPMYPVALQLAKRLLDESFQDSFEDAIGHFLAAQYRCVNHEAFQRSLERLRDGE